MTRPVAPSLSSPEAVVDAMDLDAFLDELIQDAVKRNFSQMQGQSPLAPSLDEPPLKRARKEEAKRTDYQVLASPEENALVRLRPALQQNIAEGMPIVKVHAGGQTFLISKSMLFKLSPDFEKRFSHGTEESVKGEMIWKGPQGEEIHLQTAAHIIEYAYAKYGPVTREKALSLAQLDAQFPDAFPGIFNDIISLCFYFKIEDLKEECKAFIVEEIKSNPKAFKDYFQWTFTSGCASQQELMQFFESIVEKLIERPLECFDLYPELIELFEGDYRQSSKEEVQIYQKFLQHLFVNVLVAGVRKDLEISWDREKYEIIPICKCIASLFSRFDFPQKLIDFINFYDIPGLDFIEDIPELFYVSRLSDMSRAMSRLCVTGEELPIVDPLPEERPDAEGRLKQYESLIQALTANPDIRGGLIDAFLAAFPENIYALIFRAQHFSKQSRFDASIEDINRALGLHPDKEGLLVMRGRMLMKMNKYDEALKDFNRALGLELVPDGYGDVIRSFRLRCYWHLGNPDAVIREFRPFNRGMFGDFVIYDHLFVADSFRQKGNLTRAQELLLNVRMFLLAHPNLAGDPHLREMWTEISRKINPGPV